MQTKRRTLIPSFLALFLSIVACTINVGGPSYPDQHIPISTSAVGELQSSIQTAVAAGADTGQVTLVMTEPQLTSYLANKLQAQSQPLFTDPQVYLQSGQIKIYGTANQGYLQATIQLVVTAGVDEQGQLKIELSSADFGPLPVPSGLREVITATIQEAYTGAIGPAAVGFRLEKITVADGLLTIQGRIK
jgi:hypothetical protein